MEVWGTRFLKCWSSASNKSVLKSTKKKDGCLLVFSFPFLFLNICSDIQLRTKKKLSQRSRKSKCDVFKHIRIQCAYVADVADRQLHWFAVNSGVTKIHLCKTPKVIFKKEKNLKIKAILNFKICYLVLSAIICRRLTIYLDVI